ncbi:hypothetical protein BH10PSE17_BH10PSE17_10170 [soil metagenome]
MQMIRTFAVGLGIGFAVAFAQAQVPAAEPSPAFTLSPPACRGAWTRERFVRYLRTEPVSRWGPEPVLKAARRGDAEARATRDALQNFMREPAGDRDPFQRTVNLGSEPVPLLWIDFTGDGLCDVIARWYGGTGNHDFDFFFVFRQVADGFRLELSSTMNFEISSYGERPMPLLPVFDRQSAKAYLFLQQPVLLAAGEPLTSLFSGPDDWREALVWNARTLGFDELQMSGRNGRTTPDDRLLQAMWTFVKSQPAQLRGTCPTGALAASSCNEPQ